MSRTFTVFARDPATYLGRFALFLQMSIIFGILYFNNAGGQASVMDKAYAVCWGMAIPSYMAICALPAFSFESMCYKKETKNGMYTAGAYTLATSLCQAPLVAVAVAWRLLALHRCARPLCVGSRRPARSRLACGAGGDTRGLRLVATQPVVLL